MYIGSHAMRRTNYDAITEVQILSLELASRHPSGSPNLEEASKYLDKFVYPLPYLKEGATLLVNKILIIKPTRCTNFSNLFLE